jgi:hypothetical protein
VGAFPKLNHPSSGKQPTVRFIAIFLYGQGSDVVSSPRTVSAPRKTLFLAPKRHFDPWSGPSPPGNG